MRDSLFYLVNLSLFQTSFGYTTQAEGEVIADFIFFTIGDVQSTGFADKFYLYLSLRI